MPSTLSGLARDDAERRVHRRVDVVASPSSRPAPGRTCRPASAGSPAACACAQDAVVDALVVGRARRDPRPARGWPSRSACRRAPRSPPSALRRPRITSSTRLRRARGAQVVGAAAGGDQGAGHVARGVERAADQLERGRPVQAHAALRRVHRLGDAEAERPQVAAVGDGRVPVDRGGEPRVDGGQRVGDDVRRRVGDAVEARRRGRRGERGALSRSV